MGGNPESIRVMSTTSSTPRPTGTVTFLFTDIEGSTKLWDAHQDAMQQALERHDVLLRNAIHDVGGVVFKTVGDAFCAVFAAAPYALAAATNAQFALRAEPWPEETPIRVRMALHTGPAQERDNDYFGPTLNRVARLLAAGHGGQTLVSGATQEAALGNLPEAVTLLDLGVRRLKDLTQPEPVYQVAHPDLPDGFPPLKTLDTTPNNLPQQVTSFIGREKQIAETRALLGKTRLLTLAGPGGTGKTRLSLQIAAETLDQDRYADGAWLVELAPLSDPSLVAPTVAQVLGVTEQSGQARLQTLTETLKNKKLLLVLDNCEHVLSACAQLVAALIRSCPGVTILVTSREPLGIAGEQVYRVPSLSLPDANAIGGATPASVSHFESARLFIERAQLVKNNFAVTTNNAPALAQLCYRLDGIPLAIELAAARARSLAVEQINDKLDARFRLLTGGDRAALPRQQTLKALVDWSYDLLNETEKTFFARLSVFTGGWTLEAAEAVCAFDPIEDWEVLDLLTSLADKSLVIVEEDSVAGDTRYRMLETLKQYGAEKRTESGAENTLLERHAAYFVALAEQAEPELVTANQAAWMNRLETEHDNLRTVLAWATKAGNTGMANLEAQFGLRLAGALWRFWDTRGYLGEGRAWLEKALEKDKGGESAAHAKALSGAALLAMDQGGLETARRSLEESLRLFRALGDTKNTAYSLGNLGNIANYLGDFAAARSLYEECLAFCRTLGNKHGIYNSLQCLGALASNQRDYETAKRLFREVVALNRERGDVASTATALANLGALAVESGGYEEASALFRESMQISRQIGDKLGLIQLLDKMSTLFLKTERPHPATAVWGAAESLREIFGMARTPKLDAEYAAQADRARAVLGEAAFSSAREQGIALSKDLTLNSALDYASENLGQTQPPVEAAP